MTSGYRFSLRQKRVFVAGHRGMVGQALLRRLNHETCTTSTVDRTELDLRRQGPTEDWFRIHRPEVVFLAAGTVGGIMANSSRPAEFIYDNIAIVTNVIEAARITGTERLLALGSSCIYPRLASQPIGEAALLSGPIEPTNEWYAIAKIAGLKLCAAYRRQYGCSFIAAQPTNLYGPHDRYDPAASHVVPALIARLHHAQVSGAEMVELWGTGTPRREFLHVDDLADALIFLMQHYDDEEHINIGAGFDLSIDDLAHRLAAIIGYRGGFRYDAGKPDGTPRKLLDSTKINALGWQPRIDLSAGLADAYAWYLANVPGSQASV